VRHRIALLALLTASLPCAPAGAAERAVADAARRGDVDSLKKLLQGGADVNTAEGDGRTALHFAAERGDAMLAETLIVAGANVEAGTRIGRYTPLHVASRGGHLEVVEALLRAHADPNAATTNSGATPLHLAAGSGNPDVVRALIRAGADANARETTWGQTPLIFAASRGHAEVIRALVEAGADPSATALAVDTAELEKADEAANKRIAEMLEGFKKEENGGNDWQPSPDEVQVAIEASRYVQRNWSELQKKKESADGGGYGSKDSKARDENPASYGELVGSWGGLTPLLHAARQGHVDAALALLDAGADVNQPSGGDHTTPLLMASINGQFDLAMKLLERGADPNLASDAGTTPLFAALERNWAARASYSHPIEHQQQKTTYLELLKALLEAGADPNVRLSKHLWYMEYTFGVLRAAGIDYKGATPFWRAAYALDVDAMRILKEYGADTNVPTLKPPARRRRGQSGSGFKKSVSGAFGKLGHVFGLGNPEVPVGGPAMYPIHAASGVGYGQSFAGNAHRYVPGNWVPAVKFLVEECGAEVDVRDANGYTALHHAASRGDNELVLYLVEKGADVKAKSRTGQTTADMANGPIERVSPFPETIALLVSLGARNNHHCVSC
jgi:ankyrin repeat protein